MLYLFLLIMTIVFFQYRRYASKKTRYQNNQAKTDTKRTIERVAYPLNHMGLTKSSDFDRLWD